VSNGEVGYTFSNPPISNYPTEVYDVGIYGDDNFDDFDDGVGGGRIIQVTISSLLLLLPFTLLTLLLLLII